MDAESRHQTKPEAGRGLSRRRFLSAAITGGAVGLTGGIAWQLAQGRPPAKTFIGRAPSYESDLTAIILDGLAQLGIGRSEVRGRRILLKPNLVEPHAGAGHINTHPSVLRAAAEAFRRLDVGAVAVGEGPGHRRDSILVLEESGFLSMLRDDRLTFHDLNDDASLQLVNRGGRTRMRAFSVHRVLGEVDWIVSVAKMKTHHWVGVTLSMKNLLGTLPGIVYGWPKNVVHFEGIDETIFDITVTLKPQIAIVDGIMGMDGDGPIMGSPRPSGVLVMGRNLPAVDATCSRIMSIDPRKIAYLAMADTRLGPIGPDGIEQVGETTGSVQSEFGLVPSIPAHQGIRLL